MENAIEKQIIEAAKRVFLAHGFNETNMSMIAEEAGVQRPAMYYYYRTKDKIFEAVFGDLLQGFFPRILESLQADMMPREKISSIVDTYFDQLRQTPELPLFIIRELNRDPQLMVDTILGMNHESFPRQIVSILRDKIKGGIVREIELSNLILTMFGQVIAPFLIRPIFQVLPESGLTEKKEFEGILENWKPVVVDNLCHLLLP